MSWTESEKAIYDLALANVEKTNKAIARVYLKTQREISEQLKAFYLTVNPSDSKAFQAARLTAIFKDINKRLSVITGLSTKIIEEAYSKQYQLTFNLYAYDLSGYYSRIVNTAGAWTALPFSIVSENVIMASLTKKIGEYSFNNSQILGQQQLSKAIKDAYKETLRETTAQSVTLGEGPAKLAKRLKSAFDTIISKHIRTARTELLKAYSLAQEESVRQAREEFGFDFTYIWKTRLDGRERESHAVMNGKKATKFKSNGDPIFFVGMSKGSGPRLLKGPDQKKQVIQCRCYRTNVPFAVDMDQSFPEIDGKPTFKEFIELI